MKLLAQPLLSVTSISRAKRTTEARIGASVCAGVHLIYNNQWRFEVERPNNDVPFRLKKSPLYFPENARLLGKSPMSSMI